MDKKPKKLFELICKTWPTQTYSWKTTPISIKTGHVEITPKITPCPLKKSFRGKGTIKKSSKAGIIKIKIIFNTAPRLFLINMGNILLEIPIILSKKPKPSNLMSGNLEILKLAKKGKGNLIKPKNRRKRPKQKRNRRNIKLISVLSPRVREKLWGIWFLRW